MSFNGHTVRDPEFGVIADDSSLVRVDGVALGGATRVYLVLNKPRGLVTTANDEKGRRTVYECFREASFPWIAPVGRLDQASEGLLLFTNDSEWAARITGPEFAQNKTYHVQVRGAVTETMLVAMQTGVRIGAEFWSMTNARILRSGERTNWLEIVLDEGKNRQIRRILDALDLEVLRLVRVSIGTLQLGSLAKGTWRHLTPGEVVALVP